MRTVSGSDLAQPTGTITPKVQVANAAGTLVDLSTDVFSVEYEETTDEIVNAATVVFRRGSGASSFAPLMTASPPVDEGRVIVISVDPGSGTYKEVFRGKIDDVDWPERFGDVTVVCRDQAGVINDTWIESEAEYGSDAGVALETVMQSVATDNLASPPTIYVPTATSAVVTPAYSQQQESVLTASRTLAEAIGWTIRWRYIDSLSAWRWTLFEPSRSKSVADHTFATSAYWDVSVMNKSIRDVRNVVEVEYSDTDGARLSVKVEDATSIAAYGRRYMKISESSDSPISNSTLATNLANAALSDLKSPDALLEITCRYFWPGEVGVDLYTFTANDVHFNSDQTLAAMAFRHRLAVGERPTTKILTRGKPSGGALMWLHREKQSKIKEALSPEDDDAYEIIGVELVAQSSTSLTLEPLCGAKVKVVQVYDRLYELPITASAAIGDATDVSATFVPGNTYVATIPDSGYKRTVFFVPYSTERGAGKVVRYEIGPAKVPTDGLDDLAVSAAKVAAAAIEREKILDGAVNDLKLADAAVTAAKVATAAIDTVAIADAAITAVKIGNAAVEEAKLAALAVTEAKIGAAAVTTAKLANLAVTDAILAAGAVTETKITDSSISTAKLQAAAVTAAKIAAGTITANEIAANTIVAGNIAAGTITGTEIAAVTITGGKLVAGTITASEIAAGTITSTEIATGTITAGNIAASTITGAKIAALTIEGGNIAAATIAAGKLVAETITANELAALSVTTAKINTGAVVTDKIDAGAVTAAKMTVATLSAITADLGTITAGSISAVTGSFAGNLSSSTISAAGTVRLEGGTGPSHADAGAQAVQWGTTPTFGDCWRIIPSTDGSALYVQKSTLTTGAWVTKHTFS